MDPDIIFQNLCWAILKIRILVQLSQWRGIPFFCRAIWRYGSSHNSLSEELSQFLLGHSQVKDPGTTLWVKRCPIFLQGRAILWCPWMMVLILFQCEKNNKTYQPPLSPPQKKQRAFRKQITQRAYAKLTFQKWGPAWMLVLLQHQQGSWYLCSTNSYLKLRDYMDEKGATWMLVLFQHQQCSWYLSAPTNTMFTCSAMFFCGCWTYIDRTIPIHIHVQQQQCSTSGLPGWWYMFTALLKILNRENWFRIYFFLCIFQNEDQYKCLLTV